MALLQLQSGLERLEPIIDISPTGVAVLVRTDTLSLVPGTVLPRVRLFSHGGCSLDTQATVKDVAQVSLEGGGVGLKVGLSLVATIPKGTAKSYIDTYTPGKILTDTVTNLITSRALLGLRPAHQKDAPPTISGRLMSVTPDRQGLLFAPAEGETPLLKARETYDLVGELYGTKLAITAIYQAQRGAEFLFSWPKNLTVWRHRGGGRLHHLTNDTFLEFDSPFSRQRRQFDLADVSQHGVAISCAPEDGLMVGMVLNNLVLKLGKDEIKGRGIVRNVRSDDPPHLLAGIELTSLSTLSQKRLSEFVSQNVHPKIRAATVADLNRLWDLYGALGFFGQNQVALSPLSGRIENTRRTLLTRGKHLLLQIVAGTDDQLQGTAELLCMYSGTYLLQHWGRLPESRLTHDQLLLPLLELALAGKEFQSLVALLDMEPTSSGLLKLREQPIDPEHLVWREQAVLLSRVDDTTLSANLDVQPASDADLEWVSRKLKEQMSPLEFRALGLGPEQLRLTSTSRAFHALGLERSRQVRLALGISGPIGCALIEQSAPGLSMSFWGDIVRIYTFTHDAESAANVAVALVRDALVHQRNRGKREVGFLVEPSLATHLAASGLTLLGQRLETTASRDGAGQVVNLLNVLSTARG